MYEFDAVSVSSFEAASLAAKLSEKSADGWEVVAIVPAGSDITAYVKRAGGTESAATAIAPVETAPPPAEEPAPVVAEPAGWGSAPASTSTTGESAWGSTTSSGWGSGTASSGGWGSESASPAATPTAAAPAQPVQPATPSVPAGWYHDPAGRYELRYWDGSAWTEHVSRNGQQYTDPPVA